MNRQRFSIDINAPKEKVWQTLWNEETYKAWTSIFNESSYAVSDWEEGSKIQFLSSDGSGMFSVIAEKRPNEFMSFKHLGIIKEGEEQHIDEETSNWSGALENYTLTEQNGLTQLTVEMDITEDYQQYFQDSFPKALLRVKELAEG